MYVVTFYSFKGGVGRTLALMNVAAHLVQTGKTVLLVDFDLEAPGLDSFLSFRSKRNVPGIVEFVCEYLQTNSSPDVRKFVSECDTATTGQGRLFLMRSGLKDKTYSARLSTIDWQRLYADRDGYLLFEDLKAQWAHEFRPDYVLIDSRTGHTDVGGICTRQLPDAVVACFIPNDENIDGLASVVSDIRAEAEAPARREIRIYFVPSNIPNLDDEQGILARRILQAKQRLNFNTPSCIIHRYESLSLLDNTIFVKERSHSRLANEYRELACIITQDNLQDRDVVLTLLRTGRFIDSDGEAQRSMQRRLEDIRDLHAKDGEILHEVAKLLRRLGRDEDAQALARESALLGFRSAETVLDSAFREFADGRREAALDRVREALELSNADYFDVSRAIQLCVKVDPNSLNWVVESPSFRSLEKVKRISMCDQLLVTRDAAGIAERVLRELIGPHPLSDFIGVTSFMLSLIAQGKFEAAMGVSGDRRPEPLRLDVIEAFNYAMAEWGATHKPPIDFFSKVLQVSEHEHDISRKNNCLAFAIAAWVVGDRKRATGLWRKAFELATSNPAVSFSAWRYLQVSGDQFLNDLSDVKRMIEGFDTLPPVLTENWDRRR